METRLYLDGPSALDCWRRLRSCGLAGHVKPSRIKTLSDCAYTRLAVDAILGGVDPAMREALPPNAGTARSPLYIAVSNPSERSQAEGIVSHVQGYEHPSSTYYQVSDSIFVLSPEECFLRVAPKLAAPLRIMLAMELAGTYSFSPTTGSYSFGVPSVATISSLSKHCAETPHSNSSLLDKTVRVLTWAVDDSASPMETIVVMLLSVPYRHGGYGIERPVLNVPLDHDGNVAPAGTPGTRKPDIAWPAHKLALEYNGRDYHHGIDDYARDSDRRDELEHLGYRVIPVSAEKLYDVRRFHELAMEVAHVTGKKLQLPNGFAEKRDLLRSQILPRRRRLSDTGNHVGRRARTDGAF